MSETRLPGFTNMAVYQGFLMVVALVLIGTSDVPAPLQSLHPLVAVGLGTIAAIIVYFLLLQCMRMDTGVTRLLRQQTDKLRPVFSQMSNWQIISIALLAGVGEELLFRAFLFEASAQYLSPAYALIISSVVFGLFHFVSVIYFLLATLLGLIVGGLYWYFQDLLLAIVFHAVYDIFAIGVIARRPQWLCPDDREFA